MSRAGFRFPESTPATRIFPSFREGRPRRPIDHFGPAITQRNKEKWDGTEAIPP